MSFWGGKRVLVTGGAGFIGSHVVEMLVGERAIVRVADNLEIGSAKNLNSVKNKIEFFHSDLTEMENCLKACKDMEVVLNLAARVRGVSYNQAHPAEMFTQNALIALNMLEAARRQNVDRFLVVSTACVYPRYCSIPTPETEGFKDNPEPTNYGYGWAKRLAEIQAQTYVKEYGMKIAVVRPYNGYGPRDHFGEKDAHVIPSLITRIMNDENPLIVWGSGEQSRAFVYVTDIARGMMLATEHSSDAEPLNIGSDEEIKIKNLVSIICELAGKSPKIVFDTSKPEGQPRRCADIRRAGEKIGYKPQVKLLDGLKKTIEWYKLMYK